MIAQMFAVTADAKTQKGKRGAQQLERITRQEQFVVQMIDTVLHQAS